MAFSRQQCFICVCLDFMTFYLVAKQHFYTYSSLKMNTWKATEERWILPDIQEVSVKVHLASYQNEFKCTWRQHLCSVLQMPPQKEEQVKSQMSLMTERKKQTFWVSCLSFSLFICRNAASQHREREKREGATKLIFSWLSAVLDLLTDLFLLLPQMALSSLVAFILSCLLCLLFLFVPVRPPLSSFWHTSCRPKTQEVQAKNQFSDI